jgi:hypothetical protein
MLIRAGKTGAWRDAFVTTDLSVLAKASQRKMGYGSNGRVSPAASMSMRRRRGNGSKFTRAPRTSASRKITNSYGLNPALMSQIFPAP